MWPDSGLLQVHWFRLTDWVCTQLQPNICVTLFFFIPDLYVQNTIYACGTAISTAKSR